VFNFRLVFWQNFRLAAEFPSRAAKETLAPIPLSFELPGRKTLSHRVFGRVSFLQKRLGRWFLVAYLWLDDNFAAAGVRVESPLLPSGLLAQPLSAT